MGKFWSDFKVGFNAGKSPADVANEPSTGIGVALGLILLFAMLIAYCIL